MSEFSSGSFQQLMGSPRQFLLNPHKFDGGVRDTEVENESCQDVKWRLHEQENKIHLEGVTVASVDHGGPSFRVRPDSELTLASSTATFGHQFSEHVVVDEIFARDSASYERSASCNSLQYTSRSSQAHLVDEFYHGGYHGGGRSQATVSSDPNDRYLLVVDVPDNPQETTTKPLAYYLGSSSSSSLFDSGSSLAGSSSFPEFCPPWNSKLQLSSSSPAGEGNNISPINIEVATPLGLQLNYRAAAIRNSPDPEPPTSEPMAKGFQGRLRPGRGGRGNQTRAAVSHMSLGLSSQSMAVNHHQPLKVARTTSSDFTLGKRQLHVARLATDHLEHVQRERQRRDDMSAKIATLETLLPPASKRDRVSIVHDGIHHVKALQEQVKALQEQLREARRKAEAGHGVQLQDTNKQRWSASLGGSSTSNKVEFGMGRRDVASSTDGTRPSNSARLGFGSERAEHLVERSGLWNSAAPLLGRIPKGEPVQTRGPITVELHVQVDRPGEQVQVVKCACRYSYLSSVMRTLDQLQLSLHRCSVTKLHDFVICVIVIKPTSNCSTVTAHAVSSAQIATLLQRAAVESNL